VTFPGFRIDVVASEALPYGTALLIASPSREHQKAMEGMSWPERCDYMARNRLAVAVKNIAPPEPPHALDEADRP